MHFSFGEIIVILLVAALVIKPERLPETAETLGRLFRWARKTTADIKQEIQAPLEKLTLDEKTNEHEHP